MPRRRRFHPHDAEHGCGTSHNQRRPHCAFQEQTLHHCPPWRRRVAGPVLLDLGVQAGRVLNLILGALMVVTSLTMIGVSHEKIWFWGALGIGFNTLADGLRRYQIREAGLLGRTPRLIRWERI